MFSNEIVRAFVKIEKIKRIPNISRAILREYAKIRTELNNLADANYKRINKLNKILAEYAENKEKVISNQVFAIETMVN